jgi:hypothetical protein
MRRMPRNALRGRAMAQFFVFPSVSAPSETRTGMSVTFAGRAKRLLLPTKAVTVSGVHPLHFGEIFSY